MALFGVWNADVLLNNRSPKHQSVKRHLIEALCCVIAMEDVENCEDVEDATVNELVESTIRCLRNERGPEGEELSRNVCEKILMHKKIREVGENQLRLLMENRKWQKSAQFVNAVARSRGGLYHKSLHRYYKEMAELQESMQSGTTANSTENSRVKASYFPYAQAVEQDIFLGITRVNKKFQGMAGSMAQ